MSINQKLWLKRNRRADFSIKQTKQIHTFILAHYYRLQSLQTVIQLDMVSFKTLVISRNYTNQFIKKNLKILTIKPGG